MTGRPRPRDPLAPDLRVVTGDDTEYCTPARAAELTGLSTDRLRQRADAGELPVVRDARGHRTYRLLEVRALARSTRQARRALGLGR